jgi:hypothetical protein
VKGSFVHGDINDRLGNVSRTANTFDPPDPQFDAEYVPRAPQYAGVGYRPIRL